MNDAKEIASICKIHNALNLRNEKDEIHFKLNQYCQNNMILFRIHVNQIF